MATLKVQENIKNADGSYSVVHKETEAALVKTADGGNVETGLGKKMSASVYDPQGKSQDAFKYADDAAAAAKAVSVPTGRKVNGKALNADISLTAADVGARPSTWMPSAADVKADPAGSAAAVDGKLTTHTGDAVKHITAAERTSWNGKEGAIKVASAKTVMADADALPLVDSAASSATKLITWANLITAIKGKLNSVYAAASHSHAWSAITGKPASMTPTAHKDSHKTGGADAIAPADIGAAAASHGTHVSYSTTAPVMDGTAAVGAAATVARSDHRHPIDTSRAAAVHTHTQDQVSGLATALAGKAAATKEVTVTLTAAGWTGSGPYTQTVAVTGLGATQKGDIGLAQSATAEQRTAARDAMISVTAQAAGSITVTADGDKPTVNIPAVVTMLG